MEISTQQQNGKCRISIIGELNIYEAVEAKNRLMYMLPGCNALDMDLSQVSELDTAGIQVLILARQEAGKSGKAFALVTPSQPVQDLIETYNLAEFFDWQAAN